MLCGSAYNCGRMVNGSGTMIIIALLYVRDVAWIKGLGLTDNHLLPFPLLAYM